ncbi:hypothetical protein Lser_V15G37233 [Lactuca serriola]
MAQTVNLIGQVEITSGGDVLHDLLRFKPNDIPPMCSNKMYRCDLLSGQRGDVGSTICWNFTNDGKPQASKQIIEAVDEKNHKIVFKVIGGELVEIYKTFTIIFHVEEKGGKKFAIYTYEFEKPDEDVPYPTSLMDFMTTILKEMDENASRK